MRSWRPLPTSLGTRSVEILGKSGVASSPHGQQVNCTTLPHAAVARAWPPHPHCRLAGHAKCRDCWTALPSCDVDYQCSHLAARGKKGEGRLLRSRKERMGMN